MDSWPRGAVFAADLVAEPRIDQVTVYPAGAEVTRHGTLEVPAGEHHLIIRGLPSSLDTDALHVAVGSRDVRLGAVELKKITQADYVVEGERQLQKKLEALNDQLSAIHDDISTAQTQLTSRLAGQRTFGSGISTAGGLNESDGGSRCSGHRRR